MIAELQAKSVRVALLVIDACRDNPFPRAAGRSIGNTRGLADARPARGIFTLYSAGIGQTALDRLSSNDPANNSVFTRIFAEQLKRPELHLGDLAVEVRERVAELALKATDGNGQPAPHEQLRPITTRPSAAASIWRGERGDCCAGACHCAGSSHGEAAGGRAGAAPAAAGYAR